MSKAPSWLFPLLSVILVRVALIAIGCHLADISLMQLTMLHDGWEYLRLADCFSQWPPGRDLAPENLRLFPGYPALIAILRPALGLAVGSLTAAVGCAAICSLLAARLAKSTWVAWWMVAFTPAWLLYTSMAMSEGLATLLTLSALIAMVGQRWQLTGLLIGLAILVRPVSGLLVLPLVIEMIRVMKWRSLLAALAIAALPPLIMLTASRLMWGDAITNVRDYAERSPLQWPLQSIVERTLDPSVSIVRKVQVWGIIGLIFAGGVGLWRRWLRGEAFARPLFMWHITAALFYLLFPSHWLFGSLDRYYSTLWPTALVGLAPWMPQRQSVQVPALAGAGALAFAAALHWIVNLAAVFPWNERMMPGG